MGSKSAPKPLPVQDAEQSIQRRDKALIFVKFVVLVSLAVLVGIGFAASDKSNRVNKEVSPALPAKSVGQRQIDIPKDESLFVATVDQARKLYNVGANDMAKGAARPARARALCEFVESGTVKDWLGKVVLLDTNNDGKGVLALEVGENIKIGTWNNAVSDTFDQTLIEPLSDLFPTAVQLHIGQIVKFSGTFRKSKTDCLEELSLILTAR